MNSRERFLKACKREALDRPPLWVMRQAGRYLPEYRALKEKYGFLKLVRTPELATEVTLQPVHRFQFDAAILFSDILVIPEAMGQPYSFREGSGVQMAYALENEGQIETLRTDTVPSQLEYIFKAIEMTHRELGGRQALIGFAGSPWTLATYMVEGGSSATHEKIKSLLYTNPSLLHRLLERITAATITYLQLQIQAGVDAVQIFDTWGGILSRNTFWEASAQYLEQIVAALESQVPVIVFSKGAQHWIEDLKRIKADVLGLDWTASISQVYDQLNGAAGVQGNLDPVVLNTSPEIVAREAERILAEVGGRRGHIFNLGHGILPNAKIECLEALVNTTLNYRPTTHPDSHQVGVGPKGD